MRSYERFIFLITCVSVLLFFTDSSIRAQVSNKKLQLAEQYIQEEFYALGLHNLNEVLKEDPANSEALFCASICHLNLQQPEAALQLLEKIPNPDNRQKYYLALANLQSEKFDSATSILNLLPDSVSGDPDIVKLKKQIEFAIQNYNNTKGYIVITFGDSINTADREYSSVMINKFDSVLFTSRQLHNNSAFTSDGMGFENMFLTTISDHQAWSRPIKFQSSIQSNHSHDAAVQVFNSENQMIFFHNGDLFSAKKEGGKWVKEMELKAINTMENETHCFMTEDEKTIYFSSDFMSEDGNLDLFVTRKQNNGEWTKPKPIKELNTSFDEDSPFLSQDGTFYFSSKGHNSMGGFDVFSTRYSEESDSWAPIKNLGHPINSTSDDIYFNTYGKLAYITSSRIGGFGSLDLYRILLFNKIKMKGKIISKYDRKPVAGATIDFEYGPWFLRGYSDINGNYEMSVPINKNMRVKVEKDSVKIHEGNYIVRVFFDEHNSNEYDFVVNMNALAEDDEPTLSADIFDLSDTVSINLLVKNDLKKNSLLEKVPETQEQNWVDSLNNLYYQQSLMESYSNSSLDPENSLTILFRFDRYSLDADAKANLHQLAEKLKNQRKWTLGISGYTDSIGDEMYNMRLSLKRSQAVYKYLISQNLTADKMIVKGYGETHHLQTNNSKNTQRLNRRVEIKILVDEK